MVEELVCIACAHRIHGGHLMGISRHTTGGHVSTILAKLQVRTRAATAVEAIRQVPI